jgi:hypothetical protein
VIGWWGRVVVSVEESLLGNTKAVVMGASPRTGGCRVVNINGHRFFQVSLAEEELTGVAGLDNYVVLYEGKKNGNYGNYGIVGQPARNIRSPTPYHPVSGDSQGPTKPPSPAAPEWTDRK